MRRWLPTLGLFAALTTTAACSAEEPLPPAEAGGGTAPSTGTRVGSLLTEFETVSTGNSSSSTPSSSTTSSSTTGAAEPTAVRVNAHFLDARGVPADRALEALEVWSADEGLDRDTCSLRAGRRTSDRGPASTTRPLMDTSQVRLELLDVGPITVEGPRGHMQLKARRLPDLSTSFSGVIYGSDRLIAAPAPSSARTSTPGFEAGARYVFRAPGDEATGGFRVAMQAPTPIRLVEPGPEQSALDAHRDMKLRWRPDARVGDVFFDVSAGYGPDRARLKCRLEDDGRFVLPADLLRQVAGDSDSVRIAIRRVRTRPVDIHGLDISEFTLSTVERRAFQLR